MDAIRTMNEIILAAEGYSQSGGLGSPKSTITTPFIGPKTPESSVAKGAVTAAESRGASAIIVLSDNLELPQLVSSHRPTVPVYTFCATRRVEIPIEKDLTYFISNPASSNSHCNHFMDSSVRQRPCRRMTQALGRDSAGSALTVDETYKAIKNISA